VVVRNTGAGGKKPKDKTTTGGEGQSDFKPGDEEKTVKETTKMSFRFTKVAGEKRVREAT